MKRLLKTEAFQFIINPSLWAVLGVLLAGGAFSALLGTFDSPAAALRSIETDGMMLPLALAVYGPLVTGSLSGSLTRRWAAAGFKRSEILAAKLCHLLFGCAVLLALYPLLTLLATALLQSPDGLAEALTGAVRYSLRAFPLCCGLCGLYFLLCVLLPTSAAAMGGSIGLTILIGVFSQRLYENDFGGGLMQYCPMIQLGETGFTKAYAAAAVFSVLLLILCFAVSVFWFNRKDL